MLKALKIKKRRKGFTLIELVLVIAIIGILGAMVFPQFASIAKDAEEKANIASARTIESAVNLVLLEKDTLSSTDINKYLSNIEVVLCGEEDGHEDCKGWCLTLKDNDNIDDIEIRKDGKLVVDENK